jgi:phosphoribosylformimino-5-aminoimidazole carboxamide ribotide isomerase
VILFPAIDILGGKAVRLAKGDFGARTDYDDDPLDAARRWIRSGARVLHIVDLDGARTGRQANLEHVRRISSEVSVPIQLGGGLRTIAAVADAIAAGVTRVILGTAAFNDVDFLDEAVSRYGDQVIVSVDARQGKLAASGWTEQTSIPAESVIEQLAARGVRSFVYSSIERDGMMTGPDVSEVERIAAVVRGKFVYSGGVSSVQDLRDLAALRQVNLAGVIVGKALYEGRFTVGEGQAALDEAA